MQLPILYRDEALIVVNKPAGLLVHRSALDRGATEFALQTVRDQIGQHVYPVHRLDRATSGALVFALSPATARTMTKCFASGRINKKYLAVVRGVPPAHMVVDYPLKEILDPYADRLASLSKPAQAAITGIETLHTCELKVKVDKYPTSRYALVQATPHTGRNHQIRRHLRHLGHPIVGDVTYGVGKHNRYFRTTFRIHRLLLACTEIEFAHPETQLPVHVHAPLAEDFRQLLGALGWTWA